MAITFADGVATSFVVEQPDYPYEVDVRMGLHVVRRADGGFSTYDDGSAYDHRILRCRFTLTTDDAWTAITVLRGVAVRGETIQMQLGVAATGFFPFGPDKGDLGTFTVRVLEWRDGSRLYDPLGYTVLEMTLLMVTAPSYSPSAATSEGTLQIGTVTTLRYPQQDADIKPSPQYAIRSDVTRGGTPYAWDKTIVGDQWLTEWTQPMNTLNASALTVFLTGASGRGAEIDIVSGDGSFLFGIEQIEQTNWLGGGIYTARLINGNEDETVLTLVAESPNRWTTVLRWWMTSMTWV